MTTARARVNNNFPRLGVDIWLGYEGDRSLVLQTGENSYANGDSNSITEPSLFLPEDLARVLYEALTDYFGHSGNDTRALRKDYDSERERVDKLIDAVIKKASF